MAKKHNIVADGFMRLLKGQRTMKPFSFEKYKDELARAKPQDKKAIYERMEDDLDRHQKMASHKPSGRALW